MADEMSRKKKKNEKMNESNVWYEAIMCEVQYHTALHLWNSISQETKKSNSAACFHIDIIDFKCMHTMTVCECVLAI